MTLDVDAGVVDLEGDRAVLVVDVDDDLGRVAGRAGGLSPDRHDGRGVDAVVGAGDLADLVDVEGRAARADGLGRGAGDEVLGGLASVGRADVDVVVEAEDVVDAVGLRLDLDQGRPAGDLLVVGLGGVVGRVEHDLRLEDDLAGGDVGAEAASDLAVVDEPVDVVGDDRRAADLRAVVVVGVAFLGRAVGRLDAGRKASLGQLVERDRLDDVVDRRDAGAVDPDLEGRAGDAGEREPADGRSGGVLGVGACHVGGRARGRDAEVGVAAVPGREDLDRGVGLAEDLGRAEGELAAVAVGLDAVGVLEQGVEGGDEVVRVGVRDVRDGVVLAGGELDQPAGDVAVHGEAEHVVLALGDRDRAARVGLVRAQRGRKAGRRDLDVRRLGVVVDVGVVGLADAHDPTLGAVLEELHRRVDQVGTVLGGRVGITEFAVELLVVDHARRLVDRALRGEADESGSGEGLTRRVGREVGLQQAHRRGDRSAWRETEKFSESSHLVLPMWWICF